MEQADYSSARIAATDLAMSATHDLDLKSVTLQDSTSSKPTSVRPVAVEPEPAETSKTPSAPLAAELSSGTARLPVLYVTDRAWDNDKNNFTDKRNANHQSSSDLSYGSVEVSVPIKAPMPLNSSDMGWIHTNDITAQPKVLNVESKSYADFAQALLQETQNAKSNDVLVYIHGFRTSFGKAATEAATLSEVTGKPVILYSWPAGPRTGYTVSENNVEWSSKHFELFLLQLKQQLGAENISLVSHSMGSRLIKWAAHDDAIFAQGFSRGGKVEHDKRTEELAAKARAMSILPHAAVAGEDIQKYKEIDLISPDVDRGAFINDWSNIAHDTDDARIFVSSKDQAMKLSSWLAGNPRAGSQSEPESKPPRDEQEKIEYPEALPGSQIIDFTAVDKGFYPRPFPLSMLPDIGHHIPYELLRDLHNADPSRGLQLEKIQNGEGIYFKVQKRQETN